MKTTRAALFGAIGTLAAGAAYAQGSVGSGGATATLGGRATAIGPQLPASRPTPLFTIGGTAVGIWTPVPPPYDVEANRNLASNPLPIW